MDRHDDPRRDAPVARSHWRHGRDLVFDVDRDGAVLDATPAARAWLGDTTRGLFDAVHPQDAPALVKLLAGEPPEGAELRFANLPPAAGHRVVEITATTPTAKGAVLVGRDVTRERHALRTLRAHREVLERVAAGEATNAMLDALAQSIEEASGGARVVALLVRGEDLELAAAPSLRGDAAAAFGRLRGGARPDEFPGPGALSGRGAEVARDHGLGFGWAAPVRDDDEALAVLVLFPGAKRFPSAEEQAALEAGVPLAQVAIMSAKARAEVQRASRHDPLTGVLLRPAFVAELDALARRARDALGVVIVQVDGIGAVNDELGFGAGDCVLAAVGERLAGTVRGRDVVGRWSGTRFAVACTALGRSAVMDDFALRIRAVLETPVAVGDRLVPVAVRIGTATRTGRGADAAAVVRQAEQAVPAPARPEGGRAGAGPDVAQAAEAAKAAAGPGGKARTVTDRRRDRRSGSGPIDR